MFLSHSLQVYGYHQAEVDPQQLTLNSFKTLLDEHSRLKLDHEKLLSSL